MLRRELRHDNLPVLTQAAPAIELGQEQSHAVMLGGEVAKQQVSGPVVLHVVLVILGFVQSLLTRIQFER